MEEGHLLMLLVTPDEPFRLFQQTLSVTNLSKYLNKKFTSHSSSVFLNRLASTVTTSTYNNLMKTIVKGIQRLPWSRSPTSTLETIDTTDP